MSDIRVFEPYSIANKLKRALEKEISARDTGVLSSDIETRACEEFPDFLEFLVKLYFSAKIFQGK